MGLHGILCFGVLFTEWRLLFIKHGCPLLGVKGGRPVTVFAGYWVLSLLSTLSAFVGFFRNADFHNSMDMLNQIFTAFRPQLFPQLMEGYWRVFALMAVGFLLHFARIVGKMPFAVE